MSEPIKVTREQWDAALEDARTAAFVEIASGRDMVRAVVEEVLGPRPAPDTPPDLIRNDLTIAAVHNGRVHMQARPVDLAPLLPWIEEHLLPWLRAQVEEANDA